MEDVDEMKYHEKLLVVKEERCVTPASSLPKAGKEGDVCLIPVVLLLMENIQRKACPVLFKGSAPALNAVSPVKRTYCWSPSKRGLVIVPKGEAGHNLHQEFDTM